MSLFKMFFSNVQQIFSFIWKGDGKPARFEQGAFGYFYDNAKERAGQGEGAGGGYKVQPRTNTDTAPNPFGRQG